MHAVTSGRSGRRALILLSVVAVSISGCSRHHGASGSKPSASSSSGATASRPSAAASAATSASAASAGTISYGGVELGASEPCFTTLPAGWTTAMRSDALWTNQSDHLSSGAPTPDGSGVLVEQDSATGADFSIVGAGHRVTEPIGHVARPGNRGQYSYDATDAKHVAFVFNRSQGDTAANEWDLYLFDRGTHAFAAVAHNPTGANGAALVGGWVQPVLTDDYLYWIQASPSDRGWGGSALMQYGLADHRTRVLYRGLSESFTPYGSKLLYTALAPNAGPYSAGKDTGTGPPEVVQAVDQTSGRPAPAPTGLTTGPDGANSMLSDGDLVVWNTWDGAIHAWRAAWGKTIVLIPSFSNWPEASKLGLGAPAMPRLSGHFLVWNPSTDYVYDLRTNSFARLTTQTSTEDVSGNWLSLESYADAHAYDQSAQQIRFDQSLLDLSTMPDLASCPKA